MINNNLGRDFILGDIHGAYDDVCNAMKHMVLAAGAYCDKPSEDHKPTIRLAIAKKRRAWLEGLWSNAAEPIKL